MSLYADEDITSSSIIPAAGTSSAPVAAADPLQAFAAAITLPGESPAQAAALVQAAQRFEEHPEALPEVCAQLLPMVVDGGEEGLLRAWTLEMVGLAVGRGGLSGEVKMQVAQSSLEALNKLVHSNSISTLKAVIPIFATLYPILFKLLASSRPPQQVYDLFKASKIRIISLVVDPNAQPQNSGVKVVAWKYIQKVLLAGTRAAAADPRLQKQTGNDPNVGMISRDSMLSAAELEEEAILLRNQLVSQLFTLSDPALLHPIIQTIPLLCKSRPVLAPAFITSLTSWTPAALEAKGRPAMVIRAVEKSMRMIMAHLLKYPPLSQFSAQLNDALYRQKTRLEAAWAAEQEAKRQRQGGDLGGGDSRGKHSLEAESSAQGAKRAKLEGLVAQGVGKGKGPEVDVSQFPLESVVEVVMAGLAAVDIESMRAAFENARRNLAERNADAMPILASVLGIGVVKEEEDDEILNPLDMDVDDDELLMADEEALDEAITFADFTLPPPQPLDPAAKDEVLVSLMERIWANGAVLADLPDDSAQSDGLRPVVQSKEMWMLLLARLATRGEVGRKGIADFVTADFASRSKFAGIWLNEEWYAQKLAKEAPTRYTSDLEAILTAYLPKIDGKDKSLSAFLTSLPEIPIDVIDRLAKLCEDSDRSIVGFLALRDLIETRPPIRDYALQTLLQLCTYPDRKIRVLAISTVRRWVPGSAMSVKIVEYALEVLRRLESGPKVEPGEGKMEVEGSEEKPDPSPAIAPVSVDTVQQHVELAFALSRRHQDLLDDIFRLYPRLEPEIQDTVEQMLSPLIQSLGPTEKLQSILRDFPPGADKLVLRTMTVLSAEGATAVVRDLVKGLMTERELDPRFIIPIIGTLDRAEIEKQLPRIVSLLSSPDSRDLVRTAFASVLQKLTPADLLVSLHSTETPSGPSADSTPAPAPAPTNIKSTIEAIGICFSMTAVFRSDVLASALTRIADLPTLPMVFMRTVIQAVTTYKSLVPFVANTVLPKLVARKIWTNPQLWDGFVRLAKAIAPHSFGALLQLPKEWLKDVVEKQPTLRGGLKGFLGSKPQAKAALVEIFGEA